jgi:hypothetical protein
MTLQEIKDRLMQIKQIHTDGVDPMGNGPPVKQADPELRAIAVALKLDRLLHEVHAAIQGAGESRS